jgi:hypothetical protein
MDTYIGVVLFILGSICLPRKCFWPIVFMFLGYKLATGE